MIGRLLCLLGWHRDDAVWNYERWTGREPSGYAPLAVAGRPTARWRP